MRLFRDIRNIVLNYLNEIESPQCIGTEPKIVCGCEELMRTDKLDINNINNTSSTFQGTNVKGNHTITGQDRVLDSKDGKNDLTIRIGRKEELDISENADTEYVSKDVKEQSKKILEDKVTDKIAPTTNAINSTNICDIRDCEEYLANSNVEAGDVKGSENELVITLKTNEEDSDVKGGNEDCGTCMSQSNLCNSSLNFIRRNENISLDDQKNLPEEQNEQNDDLLTYLLNNPEPEYKGKADNISFWGFSMQGCSHGENDIKCQDKCAIRVMGMSKKYVVAGIADGLGSCVFSDEGAAVAISSALDEIEKFFAQNENPTEDSIIDSLKQSMRTSHETVRQYADQKGEELNEYYSTLTVVIFNGKDAFIAHAGDDGVVVLADSGLYGLVTTRHKGDTVNSVVPLQGETNWEFMIVRDIVGVVMATDGVLDAFVKREKEENRVFFPFIQMITKTEYGEIRILEKYKLLFKIKTVQDSITDDITIIAMINDETVKNTDFQPFDKEEWFEKNRERSESIFKALYPTQEQTEDIADSWLDRDKELLIALEQLKML